MQEHEINKGLATLVILAIVFSVGGTIITLSSFPNGITGFATDSETGTASFTVAALTQITLSNATVNFGTCSINPTNFTTYSSNASTGASLETTDGAASCDGTFPYMMILENSGNKYVNLTASSNVSATNFIDAISGGGDFNITVINAEAASCKSGMLNTFNNNSGVFVSNFTTADSNRTLCLNFSPVNTEDTLHVAFRVKLPPDTKEGSRSALITFTAEDSIQ